MQMLILVLKMKQLENIIRTHELDILYKNKCLYKQQAKLLN